MFCVQEISPDFVPMWGEGLSKKIVICPFCFRIHPRNKQDVAYRLTLGARAVAYNEKDVPFLGPFPHQILSTPTYVNITYDQTVSVAPSNDTFEVLLVAG